MSKELPENTEKTADLVDVGKPSRATPRARERAKQMLLDNHMIGVMIDPNVQYPVPEDALETHKPAELKQDFSEHQGKLYAGRRVFKDSDAFEKYQKLGWGAAFYLSSEKLRDYFNPDFLEGENIASYWGKIKTLRICADITLNPFSDQTVQAREHVAEIISQNVHPRRVEYAKKTGHYFIVADARNLEEAKRNNGFIGGSYSPNLRNIDVAASGLKEKVLARIAAHEAAHMTDFIEVGAQDHQSLFLKLSHIKDKEHYAKAVQRDLDKIEPILVELAGNKSEIYSEKATRLMEALKKQGLPHTAEDTLEAIKDIYFTLKFSLPPKQRYLFNPADGERRYKDQDIEKNPFVKGVGINSCKEEMMLLRVLKEHYLTTHSQIEEIPAIVAEACDPPGMQFARILIPELYREVMDVQALNPNLRDNPKKFEKGVEAQGGAEKLLAGREAHREERKKVQADWLNRIAGEEGANSSKSK